MNRSPSSFRLDPLSLQDGRDDVSAIVQGCQAKDEGRTQPLRASSLRGGGVVALHRNTRCSTNCAYGRPFSTHGEGSFRGVEENVRSLRKSGVRISTCQFCSAIGSGGTARPHVPYPHCTWVQASFPEASVQSVNRAAKCVGCALVDLPQSAYESWKCVLKGTILRAASIDTQA